MAKVSALTNVATSVAAADTIYLVQGGVSKRATLNVPWAFGGDVSVAGVLTVTGTFNPATLGIGGNAFLTSDGANLLAQRNGAQSQTFRIYNTFTDASNYERVSLKWNANQFQVAIESAGTGNTTREIAIYGSAASAIPVRLGVPGGTTEWRISTGGTFPLIPGQDNTFDFGTTGLRIRNAYFGMSVNVGSFTPTGNGLIRLKTGADIQGNGISLGNVDSATGTARIEYSCSDTARVQAYIKFNKLNATTGRQGDIEFWIAGSNSDTGDLAFKILNSGPGVLYANYLAVAPRESGQAPMIVAAGTDTNVGMRLRTQAAGQINFETSGGTLQVAVTHTASAVNTIALTGAVTVGRPQLFFTGSDTDVGSVFITKGAGTHQFCTNALGSNIQFEIGHVASAVNFARVLGGATGADVQISAQGETNVTLKLLSKGTGNIHLEPASGDVRWGKALVALGGGAAPTFGTIGGSGPATAAQNSWMRVQDSAGNAFWVPAWK